MKKMPFTLLCLIVVVFLSLTEGTISAQFLPHPTREQLINQVTRTFASIYISEEAHYLELNQYADDLYNLGLDPYTMLDPDYWELRMTRYGTGYRAEVKGIKEPVLGELWRMDQNRRITQHRGDFSTTTTTTTTVTTTTSTLPLPRAAYFLPTAPSGLTLTAGDNQVTLTWDPNRSDERVTSYTLYMATTAWTPWWTWTSNLPGAIRHTGISCCVFSYKGLTNGTLYYFSVSAINRVGEGNMSTQGSATPQLPDLTMPFATQVIGPRGGIVSLQGTINRVELDIPDKALPSDVDITIRQIPTMTPPPYEHKAIPIGNTFIFEPKNLFLSKRAKVTFTYQDKDLPRDIMTHEGNLTISPQPFETQEDIDTVRNRISTFIDRLSTHSLSIKKCQCYSNEEIANLQILGWSPEAKHFAFGYDWSNEAGFNIQSYIIDSERNTFTWKFEPDAIDSEAPSHEEYSIRKKISAKLTEFGIFSGIQAYQSYYVNTLNPRGNPSLTDEAEISIKGRPYRLKLNIQYEEDEFDSLRRHAKFELLLVDKTTQEVQVLQRDKTFFRGAYDYELQGVYLSPQEDYIAVIVGQWEYGFEWSTIMTFLGVTGKVKVSPVATMATSTTTITQTTTTITTTEIPTTTTTPKSVASWIPLPRTLTAPSGLTATAGDGHVTLTWDANPSKENERSYTLYLATTPWTTWTSDLPDAREYRDIHCCRFIYRGLKNGTTYYFALAEAYENLPAAVSATPQIPPKMPFAKQVIGPRGGIVSLQGTINRVELDIPEKALASDVEIIIRQIPNPEDDRPISNTFSFEPEDLVLSKVAKITFTYQNEDLWHNDTTDEGDLLIFMNANGFYPARGAVCHPFKSEPDCVNRWPFYAQDIDTVRNRISLFVNRLSQYFLGMSGCPSCYYREDEFANLQVFGWSPKAEQFAFSYDWVDKEGFHIHSYIINSERNTFTWRFEPPPLSGPEGQDQGAYPIRQKISAELTKFGIFSGTQVYQYYDIEPLRFTLHPSGSDEAEILIKGRPYLLKLNTQYKKDEDHPLGKYAKFELLLVDKTTQEVQVLQRDKTFFRGAYDYELQGVYLSPQEDYIAVMIGQWEYGFEGRSTLTFLGVTGKINM